MVGDGVDVTLIGLNKITPNDYNPNVVPDDILAKLRAEIAQKRLCVPIIVRRWGNDGYQIVDGYHRWLICRELGWQEIPCVVADFDDKEAKIKTLQLNYMRGSAVPIKLASLIHDLSKEMKLEDLVRRLPYEEVQLQDNLELLKLPENYESIVEEEANKEKEALPVVVSFVLYKRQVEVVEEAIAIAVKTLPEGTKNQKAVALERICADYIEKQRLTTEGE